MTHPIGRYIALAMLAAGATWGQSLSVSCTPTALPSTVGSTVNVTCSASGGQTPYTWSISPNAAALPPGLTQDPGSGAIAGTLQDPAGPYSFTVVATDSTPGQPLTGTQTYSGTTVDPLTVLCTSPKGPVEVGVLYTNSCTASHGTPPYTWSIAGTIVPPGLPDSLTQGNPATINYTPTAPLPAYQYSVVATDSSGTPIKKGQTFTGAIVPPVKITTTSPLPPAVMGAAYSQQFAATAGVAPYGWSAAGLNGTGLSMSATGLMSGIPTTAGPINFNVTVIDSVGGTSIGPFSLTVNPALTINNTSPLPTATIGTPYNVVFTASGGSGTGYTWSVTGQPAWLNMSPGGTLIGNPPATAVTSTFTVQVTDSANDTTSGSFTLPVTLAITSTSPLPTATIGAQYSQTLAAGGGTPPYTWTLTGGNLPAGLNLSPNGQISGTPVRAAVTSTFTATVSDSLSATAGPMTFVLPVALAITTSSPLASGAVDVPYNQALTGAGGTPPYTWAVTSGALPDGLSLAPNSGIIDGKPTKAGNFQFTIGLTDSATPPGNTNKIFVITIAGGLTITTTTLPNATIGVSYSQTLTAAGGSAPYTWAVTTGSLPAGLSLDPSTGKISGKPTGPAGPVTFTVTVTDSTSTSASQQLTITVVTPPVINTTSLPNATVGGSYSQTLSASGGTTPYTWSISSGSLPANLSLSTSGVISGVPTTVGASSFTVLLTDATGVTATKALTITVVAGLTITNASPLPTGEVTVHYSQTFTATGGLAPYTWVVTAGALPGGLTLSSAGLLAGTPSSAGTFNFTVQVTDANHLIATGSFSITIAAALNISTPPILGGGSVGASYTQTLTAAAGVPPDTWTLSANTLPPGLSLSPSGTISGVPATVGTYTFTLKVTDSVGAIATRQFTITIAAGLTVSTAPTLPGATVGTAYSYTLQASGGSPPYTWSNTLGTPPPGITVRSNGNVTGIPTTGGTYQFTVQVTDSLQHTASQQMSLTVTSPLTITTASLPGAALGASYSQTLTASGGTAPYSWSLLSGTLPTGLSLSGAGLISGTTSAAGTFTFTVQVTDSASLAATKQFSIVVSAGLSITTAAALPDATVNQPYTETLNASGGTEPYSWAVTGGDLPTGMTLSPSGTLSGTPTATGAFTFTATVTDSANKTASQQFTLNVTSGLQITTASLPGGKVGTPYSQDLAASGGTSPYTFSKSAGTLPPGLSLHGATLSGTPTTTGSFTFTITVTDSASATATKDFTITIGGVAITTPATLPTAAVGTAYSQTLAAAGTTPFTWTVTAGALPDGLSLDKSTGVISGKPTAAGKSNVTIQVTDKTKATASTAFTLTVISASYTGVPSTATPAQQFTIQLALAAAYPQEITGQATLTFAPDANLVDDPSIQFSAGGRTADFTIPANSTAPVSFSLQPGTVAGTITLNIVWQASGASLPAPAALTQTIQIAPAAPVITVMGASSTPTGFQVQITGLSTTRELTQALVHLTPTSGQTLQQSDFTIDLGAAATSWFQGSSSDQYGSQFVLTIPFTVSNGTASAISSVSVQLVNTQGTSTSSSATL